MPDKKTKKPGLSPRQQLAALGKVLGYMLSRYKWHFIVVVLCIFGTVLATLNGTLFMQRLIDDYIIPLTQSAAPDFSALAMALGKVAAIYAAGVLCAFVYSRIMVTICQGVLRDVRIELFDHMERLPISYFDTHAHGDVMSVYTNDVDTLRQVISQGIPQLINASVTVIASFVSMLVLNVPLTLLTLAMIAVMLFVTSRIAGQSAKYFGRQQRDLGAVNGYIEEMLEGQKVVKVFCHEDACLQDFRALNDQLRDSADRANTFANITMPVNANIGNISYVLCAIVGALLALSGYSGLTLGVLVSFLTLNKNASMPVSQVSMQMNYIAMAMAGADRIFRLLEEPVEVDGGSVHLVQSEKSFAWEDDRTRTPLRGAITLEHVNFGYTPEKPVLHDISLFAKPGQKIAFVGSTGAGKTTITNLINRFYDISSGSITCDGIDVQRIRKADLRRSLGIVLQDTNLFTDTVMENIRYGRLDATDEDCIRAAKLTNADGFIRRLPDGYNTVLTAAGESLSQGQRQLLAIARAAVANPPMLILDEATSSIDTRTEALVQQGMDALMQGRTTFVIAHRLSTVRNADCIMVLEGGRIIERGTHDELISARGRYWQLYTGGNISGE